MRWTPGLRRLRTSCRRCGNPANHMQTRISRENSPEAPISGSERCTWHLIFLVKARTCHPGISRIQQDTISWLKKKVDASGSRLSLQRLEPREIQIGSDQCWPMEESMMCPIINSCVGSLVNSPPRRRSSSNTARMES